MSFTFKDFTNKQKPTTKDYVVGYDGITDFEIKIPISFFNNLVQNADKLELQYSNTPDANDWHFPNHDGDTYMRQRIGTSAWSNAMKISSRNETINFGEDDSFDDFTDAGSYLLIPQDGFVLFEDNDWADFVFHEGDILILKVETFDVPIGMYNKIITQTLSIFKKMELSNDGEETSEENIFIELKRRFNAHLDFWSDWFIYAATGEGLPRGGDSEIQSPPPPPPPDAPYYDEDAHNTRIAVINDCVTEGDLFVTDFSPKHTQQQVQIANNTLEVIFDRDIQCVADAGNRVAISNEIEGGQIVCINIQN